MAALTFTVEGGVNVSVTITEQADGTLKFDLAVLDDTGSIGDLNGLFFDIADGTMVDSLSVSGADVTDSVMDEDSVTKVDGYNNVNGEVVKELDKFDAGVQFGTAGIGEDDIRDTSFILSHDDPNVELSLDMFLGMDFAVRLTSVGEEGGTRDDSLKLGTTAPPEVDPEVEEPGPEYVANDDSMTVSNLEGFNDDLFDFFLPDVLDPEPGAPLGELVTDIRADDTQDGQQYQGAVLSANGVDFSDSIEVAGSNGGLMRFYSDGTVDFSANGEFDLPGDETATTTFTYGIEGGAEATVTVNVFAFDDDIGGGLG